MRAELFWAGARFSAVGGRTEALLQAAAENGIGLRKIRPCLGGFTAQCRAAKYRKLAHYARIYRVRLHLVRRRGLFFALRKTLRRTGLFAGLAVWGLLMLYSERYVWAAEYPGLTLGQKTRAAGILRTCGIDIGAEATQELLVQGEAALVEASGGEFGWASLNFTGGRLTVELAPAEAVPSIEQNHSGDLCARVGGEVLSTDVERGTAAVKPGDIVAAGQVLIAANRTDRKGAPVPGYTAGNVQARFTWNFSFDQPLAVTVTAPTGRVESSRSFLLCGKKVAVPQAKQALAQAGQMHQRHGAFALFGMTLPLSYTETETVPEETRPVTLSESLALARARLAAERALAAEWPDAVTQTKQETYQVDDGILHYETVRSVAADICEKTENVQS